MNPIEEIKWLKTIVEGYVLTEDELTEVLDKFKDFFMNEMYNSDLALNFYQQFIQSITK